VIVSVTVSVLVLVLTLVVGSVVVVVVVVVVVGSVVVVVVVVGGVVVGVIVSVTVSADGAVVTADRDVVVSGVNLVCSEGSSPPVMSLASPNTISAMSNAPRAPNATRAAGLRYQGT
jgi:hypothetical protein